MQQTSAAKPTCVVRYPKAVLISPTILLAISAVGLHMARTGRGHWTFWHVGSFAAAGIWFLLYVTMYRTAFTSDAVEQRVFPGFLRRLQYVEIRQVKWKGAGAGRMLLLISTDGKRMKIYGSDDQLIEAQDVLFDQIPQVFENRA
jgi:hypothetical protein